MLNTKEDLIAQQFLKEHADYLGRQCCNDCNFPETWTVIEKQEFLKEFYVWNGDPENYDPQRLNINDFSVARFLSHKMTNNNNEFSIKLRNNSQCKESWLLNYMSESQQQDLLQTISNLSGPYIIYFKKLDIRVIIKVFNTHNDYLVDLTDYENS